MRTCSRSRRILGLGPIMVSTVEIFDLPDRSRLGFEPVHDLFTRVVAALAGPERPGSWLAGLRLVVIDGTVLDLADTPTNVDFFRRPESSRGEHATFPQARLAALAESGMPLLMWLWKPCRCS